MLRRNFACSIGESPRWVSKNCSKSASNFWEWRMWGAIIFHSQRRNALLPAFSFLIFVYASFLETILKVVSDY
jgi:hypothetical protein